MVVQNYIKATMRLNSFNKQLETIDSILDNK